MLSKRNFFMMLIMILVVLVLFLSSSVLKEFYNDYDVNHAAETLNIEKIESQATDSEATDNEANMRLYYFGQDKTGYFDIINEWTEYRKNDLTVFQTLDGIEKIDLKASNGKSCLLVDGEMLKTDAEKYSQMLTEYVSDGGVVIFYRMPRFETIKNCKTLQTLLGIQHLRAESVELREIRIFSGFMLGGETHYYFDVDDTTGIVDIESEIPWYDISSRTKTYMVGIIPAEQSKALGLDYEDMPAIIWRSNMGNGSVFAVNGDYVATVGMGILDSMIYESQNYYLYSVVNAQNLFIMGFPNLTNENQTQMTETYGMNVEHFSRDILWPSFMAAAHKSNWKITSFLSVKQSDKTKETPKHNILIDYLKYLNEESGEAGVSLGRIDSSDIRRSVKDEKQELDKLNLNYSFTGGYVSKENKQKLNSLINKDGNIDYFGDIRTVVGERNDDDRILYWLTDKITYQNSTADAYIHTYKDSLRLKSVETALGYSAIQVDMYRVFRPHDENDQWQNLAHKLSANIDTYWKPFLAFDKTTVSKSDERVRNFLNGSVNSFRDGNKIFVKTNGFEGEAYLLLRTHGEKIEDIKGGSFKKVEDDAYLITLTSDTAKITLKSNIELYYEQ